MYLKSNWANLEGNEKPWDVLAKGLSGNLPLQKKAFPFHPSHILYVWAKVEEKN